MAGIFALIAILQFIPKVYIYCGVSVLVLCMGSYLYIRIRWHLHRKYHELEAIRIRSREIHKDTIGYYDIDGTPHLFEHMLATQELPAIERGKVIESSILPAAPAFKDMPTLPEGTYCLGYGQDGMILGDIEYLLSTLVVGRPGTGKTTGMRYLAAQLLRNHGTPVVLDPHLSVS